MERQLIVLLLAVVGCIYAKSGYIFTIPKVVQPNAEEQACLTLIDVDFTQVKAVVEILDTKAPEVLSQQQVPTHTEHQNCFGLRIPQTHLKELNVQITGRSQDPSVPYEFSGIKKIGVAEKKQVTFIQTDKPMYKPGQTVRFRILTVTENLKPKAENIPIVWIQNPNGVRMMQWRNVPTEQGLGSLDMALSSDPVQGEWRIYAEINGIRETQTFAVEEYVLPKYEVTVNLPSFVVVDAEFIKGEICARYTYGKPVKGDMKAEVCVKGGYGYYRKPVDRPCVIVKSKINGCSPFEISGDELMLASNQWSIWNTKLQIVAEVTEELTGITLNTTHDGTKITRDVLKIDMSTHSPKYFKPGLVYYGKAVVTRPDGSPAQNEMIEISLRDWSTQYNFAQNFTTDTAGHIRFGLPPLKEGTAELSIAARSPQYTYSYLPNLYIPNAPHGYHRIKQWWSPSGSVLQIKPVDEVVPCGQSLALNVTYTTEANTNFKFHYQVISRGNIVKSGHKHHHFKHHDFEADFVDERFEEIEDLDPVVIDPPRPIPVEEEEGLSISIVPELCYMAPKTGRCRARIPSWHFDAEAQTCKEFIYGGCDGNENRFKTKEACLKKCGPEETKLKPERPPPPEPPTLPPTKAPEKMPVLPHVADFHFNIPIDHELSPNAKVLVFYVREDGETIADSITVKTEKCLLNKVEMKFGDKSKYPGETTTLHLKGDAGSLCAVGVVDKSVQIMGGNNQITLDKVFDYLSGFDLTSNSRYVPYERDTYCDKKQDGSRGEPVEDIVPFWGRWYSKYYDTIEAFKATGIAVLSDMEIETRPCSQHYPIYYDGMEMAMPMPMRAQRRPGVPGPAGGRPVAVPDLDGDGAAPPAEAGSRPPAEAAVEVRNYFPETWLWDIERIGAEGEVSLEKEIPHTITEWVGSSFCTNTESGMGVSETTSITAFQPFFVSLTLPYSVVRGETVPLLVSVFNYLSDCSAIKVELQESSAFEVLKSNREADMCVCGNEAKSTTFLIVPNQLEEINITVSAASVDEDELCGNGLTMSSEFGAKDVVTRPLLVEAEGREEEYSVSSFICPSDSSTEHMELINLALPADLVADSAKANVAVIGDVMGPALSGLDKLLKLPTGCGEQNMLKFAPNIFVMQYLTSTNQVNEEIKSKAIGFMQTGYQRELTYRHDDGSYSAFGNRDPSGSTWLTAFVVKSFAEAQPFIYIDDEDLQRSVNWFKSLQQENGCFPQVGKVLHKAMKGGLSSGGSSPATLTAYVLIAMLEAGVDKEDKAVVGAVRCIASQDVTDTYSMALIAYAYTLYDKHSSLRNQMMHRLEEVATEESGLKYWKAQGKPTPAPTVAGGWTPYHKPVSADVEMTSYALMALLGGGDRAVTAGLPVVRWLTKQRNAYGGFSSTQDTIVALQALAKFASEVYSGGQDISVRVSGNGVDKTFQVNNDNSLLLQREPVSLPNALSVHTKGSGCAFVQANVKYNVQNISTTGPEEPAFMLKVNTETAARINPKSHCDKRIIHVCTRYNGPDEASNMAVVTIKMVSGWIPDKDSIKKLQNYPDLQLKKYEIDANKVNLYFDELTTRYKCFKIMVHQDIEVQHAKPASVHVFDYYQTELSTIVPYSLRQICGTKEEAPYGLSWEEYDRFSELGVQVRQPSFPRPTKAPSGGCPLCLTEVPDDVTTTFCEATYAYKSTMRKKGKSPLKIQADIRPLRKKLVAMYVRAVTEEGCTCPTLSDADHNTKVLIMTKENKAEKAKNNRKQGSLKIGSDTVVIPLNIKTERKLRKAMRNGVCDI